MSFGEDEEILQDFLVEAGEILEQLSEQLVDLEQSPDDNDLLNAIFRGFHTVKGGAGFLQLTALVDLCHVTENMFDLLRNGDLKVNSELMDVALQSLDAVNDMFAQVQEGTEPTPAEQSLFQLIESHLNGTAGAAEVAPAEAAAPVEPEAEAPATPEPAAEPPADGDMTDAEFETFLNAIGTEESAGDKPAEAAAPASDEITEDEFDNLLDELHGKAAPGAKASEPASDEITEDEFEQLLDELHGSGAPKGAKTEADAKADDNITDSEFENLLDELHGVGKGPATGAPAPVPEAPAAAPAAEPAKVEAPAAEQPAVAKPAAKEKKAKPAAKAGAKEAPAGETTVRVDTQRLDDIMNMVGELVLVRNRLVRLGLKSGDEDMAKAVSNLDVVTADLQTTVMKTRMQPIKKVFGRFPRVVRDLARNLKKEVNLELQGEETDLDKNLVEALADPLVHLVRNAVDHGVEMPDVREAAGKPRTGKVILSAEQEGDHILLSITDDGAGMDPNKLRGMAVDKGLFDEDTAARFSDTECFDLIFAPGFSTKTEISDVSGRGVGMDVVKTKITQLNGSIEIQSEMGKGSRLLIKVPLTLAIMPTLMVMLGSQTFALPLVSVNEIFHMDLRESNIVDGQEVITIRDKALPLFYLKRWLVTEGDLETNHEEAHVVIVSVGTQRVGFVVDQLIGQEEVVIKPLGKMLQGTPGMAGATITGDGRIALILDVPSMLNRYAS